ncbi:acyltransferase family protein [Cronobacter universalis]|uniref:acyltransferase family protein n=1 Tax=Cronobacter universalis TaxID=535744 RepID=UPI0024AF4817|nr:acyltransferase family protein [Cronobacter universalis]MDI7660639.1 acyltransferase family protein [Cronobacter universalis]
MSNQRIEWVDTLKFIGIFYIYIGHLGAAAGKLYPFVFSFHVPLFFFISGLFYKRTLDPVNSLLIIKKSFVKIIIPYIFFSILGIAVYALKWNLPSERILGMLSSAAMGIRNQVPITSLWFLPCLFVVIAYYTLANLIFRNAILIFIVSLTLYCLTPLWGGAMPSMFFNIDSALHYLCYFSFGVLISIKVKTEWPAYYEGKNRLLIMGVLILSFLYFAYSYQYGAFSLFKEIKLPEIRYLVYFFSTCFMFLPSMAVACFINIPSLSIMGRNSLVLCGTEQILKVMVPTFLLMFDIELQIKDPLQAVLYVSVLMTISYYTIIKIYDSFSLSRVHNGFK